MKVILDIHTHHCAPQPAGVISVSPEEFNPFEDQLYSVGIHPWATTDTIPEEAWILFESVVDHPQVVAIGESGIDLLKGAPLFRQIQVMRRQIEISERIRKPLIIHDVKAHDVIIGLKKDIKPEMPWLVHGFRGKPSVAKMLSDAGIWLSFGAKFNDETVLSVPFEKLLAETDDSDVRIEDVLSSLSGVLNRDISGEVAENAARFLCLNDNPK